MADRCEVGGDRVKIRGMRAEHRCVVGVTGHGGVTQCGDEEELNFLHCEHPGAMTPKEMERRATDKVVFEVNETPHYYYYN